MGEARLGSVRGIRLGCRQEISVVRLLRRLVAILGFGGGLLFAAAFVTSYVNPGLVEHHARLAIQAEIGERVDVQLDRLEGSRLSAVARRLVGQSRAEADELRRKLREGLPRKIAGVVAQMQRLDCPCRAQVERNVTNWFEAGIRYQEGLQARLEALIRSQYMEVAEKVLREFRIFTGVNALVFLLLGIAVVVKRKAGVHLLPAAGVLAAASVAVGYFYLFEQDWLHTLLFGDYVGFWYLGSDWPPCCLATSCSIGPG